MSADSSELFSVTVVYAREDVQRTVSVEVPKGATIRAAVERSRIQDIFPEIDLAINKVGIFNKLRELDHLLGAGDRIEIYRPLLIDPKEARRRNAAATAKND